MGAKTAKLFINGGSQAVRLPAEFRFEGRQEVYIRKDSITGDVILSAKPAKNSWAEFFAYRDQLAASEREGFLSDRPLNEPLKPNVLLDE